jgi:predicted alpha-1,2-mannosidase
VNQEKRQWYGMRRILLPGLLVQLLAAAPAQTAKQPVDYVNPNIGTIGILLTSTAPVVQVPHGMAQVVPVTTPGISDRYLADKIFGFTAGPAVLMATTHEAEAQPSAYASAFDHDFETATPCSYAVRLDDTNVRAELTATRRAAIYRFTFPQAATERMALSLRDHASLTVVSATAVEGSEELHDQAHSGKETTTKEYFYAEFSAPFRTPRTWQAGQLSEAGSQTGDAIGFTSDFAATPEQQVQVRVGVSYISAEQARQNLKEEIPGWRFEQVKAQGRAAWNRALAQIAVTGGSEKQRTIFYTGLYRALGRMTDITEDGKYWSGFDGQVHDAEGHDFYVNDGLWDTYRSMHPLQLLLEPRLQQDMIRSYLRMYEQSGWLPAFPAVTGEEAVMIGHHAAALITDTYMKGYRDFDAGEAYAAMRKNALQATMLPWTRGPLTTLDRVYFDKGFFPALAKGEKETETRVHSYERRQAVSVTLENSYDNWCVAQMAKALGKDDDYKLFMKLAGNYRNVFNPAVGWMAPRSADGKWVADFDPKLGGGIGARDYFTEVNAWLSSYQVQHDPAGLIELMGGRDRFNARLDQLFVEQPGESKFEFLAQFPDATGLTGQYAQGNEPSFHIPYLYDFSGQPWKAQKRLRQLMDVWYGDGPMGIPGDDDGGETSSWYVMSAMGFYPVCPGSPVYEIGSPIFAESRVTLGNGKIFAVRAAHVSAQNKYIQSATLNGKALDRAWFRHADIAQGGTLVLVMGPEPNRQWGSAPDAAPPSMSDAVNRLQ